MKVLLDTHAFLWLLRGQNVSKSAREAYLDLQNELYLSAASYWEICIKISIGKLNLASGWSERFEVEIEANGIRWLPIRREHCAYLVTMPKLHRDPFDHLLIAQAQVEGMTLLTADKNIHQYGVPTWW